MLLLIYGNVSMIIIWFKPYKPFKYNIEPEDDWMMVAEKPAPYGTRKTDEEDSGH